MFNSFLFLVSVNKCEFVLQHTFDAFQLIVAAMLTDAQITHLGPEGTWLRQLLSPLALTPVHRWLPCCVA